MAASAAARYARSAAGPAHDAVTASAGTAHTPRLWGGGGGGGAWAAGEALAPSAAS